MEGFLVDALTQEGEITVVVPIVKRTQLHGYRLLAGGDDTGELVLSELRTRSKKLAEGGKKSSQWCEA